MFLITAGTGESFWPASNSHLVLQVRQQVEHRTRPANTFCQAGARVHNHGPLHKRRWSTHMRCAHDS